MGKPFVQDQQIYRPLGVGPARPLQQANGVLAQLCQPQAL
jgi:hypothetical protein